MSNRHYELTTEAGEPALRLALEDEVRAQLKADLAMWEDLLGVDRPPGGAEQRNLILVPARKEALARLLAVARGVL